MANEDRMAAIAKRAAETLGIPCSCMLECRYIPTLKMPLVFYTLLIGSGEQKYRTDTLDELEAKLEEVIHEPDTE
jgi:hypothetical protein